MAGKGNKNKNNKDESSASPDRNEKSNFTEANRQKLLYKIYDTVVNLINNNNNKQFSIPLRQIFTSKKWLHQSGSGIISVNKINTSSGLADTNKDRKHAKHQNSKCTNIYKRKKTKHKSKYIQTKATVLLTFNKYYLI